MNLYEMSLEGREIEKLLTDGEGELTPELEARLNNLMIAGPQRIEAAAIVVQSMEASAMACEEEVKRLAARAKSFQDNASRLKSYISLALDTAFGGRVKTDKFTVWTQASADHVAFDVLPDHTIEEVEAFDPSLVRVKKELDKVALKERFKRGEPLPAAIEFTTMPGKRSTRIK